MRSPIGQVEVMARRKSVALWIEKLTGCPVPTSSDHSFRAVLKDGVLLCQVMNAIKPYSVSKVVELCNENVTEASQSATNIESFTQAAERYGMPRESLFTVADLVEGGSWDECPRVVECLYQLESLALEKGSEEMVNNGGIHNAGVKEGPTGVTKLMEECTSLLKNRMMWQGDVAQQQQQKLQSGGHSPTGYSPMGYATQQGGPQAVRSLEGMLQQVLAGITTAQERRGRRDCENMEKYIKSLEDQIELLGSQQMQDHASMTSADYEYIDASSSRLADQLEEYRNVNKHLEENLENERSVKNHLESELTAMKTKVESLDGFHTKYRKIQDENRMLYNMVQDLRGNIRVFCRVRPLGATGDATENCIDVGVEGGIAVCSSGGRSDKKKTFKFDKVFSMDSSQAEVYAETQPLIRSVLDGYNVCIFAYGQTGSGKTHTMSGTNVEQYSGRGINYRALDDLFDIKGKRSEEVDFQINVQMLEIYNEVLRDLLVDDENRNNNLAIRSTEKSGLNVPDAVQKSVECTEDVLEVMDIGSNNRAVGGTKMNDRSSRSHSVLTVVVAGTNRLTGVRTHGCLHLVDLAGSERIARSQATGDRLEEAKHINKSLSALGDVMAALASKSNHVPFRNSKLTQLLQDSLSGQAKSMMFMHVAPEMSSRGETLSTAMFGARVSQITLGQAQKNAESGKIFEAREAISKLTSSSQTKDQKIKELAKVVETERAAAVSAMTEKQRMEEELKSLREQLNSTRKSVRETEKQSRCVTVPGLATDRRVRSLNLKDPDAKTLERGMRRVTSAVGDRSSRREPLSSRSTASRVSTASRMSTMSRNTNGDPPSRPTRTSTLRTSSSRAPFGDNAGGAANRPSTAAGRLSSRKTVAGKDPSRTITRSFSSKDGASQRPATAGPKNPRRVALAQSKAAAAAAAAAAAGGGGGGWR
ncbi:hypothetical protein BSKO_12304 [Bryopsis sp. KO-2023]|nr:hypothetical protein BSKO_12304 [Bryopsis sp. KO-2023]